MILILTLQDNDDNSSITRYWHQFLYYKIMMLSLRLQDNDFNSNTTR